MRDVLSADRDEKSPSAKHDLLTSMPHGELVEQASQPPVAAAGSSPRYDAGAKLTTPPCGELKSNPLASPSGSGFFYHLDLV